MDEPNGAGGDEHEDDHEDEHEDEHEDGNGRGHEAEMAQTPLLAIETPAAVPASRAGHKGNHTCSHNHTHTREQKHEEDQTLRPSSCQVTWIEPGTGIDGHANDMELGGGAASLLRFPYPQIQPNHTCEAVPACLALNSMVEEDETQSLLCDAARDVQTFFCKVCLENCHRSLAFSFTGKGGCHHRFCRHCLHSYVRGRVVEGQVSHPCPLLGEDGCTASASDEDIRQLVSAEVFEKYKRFSKLKSNSNYRDCPSCGKLNLGNEKIAEMHCDTCGYSFCFFHSNAHEGTSCRDYAQRMRREDMLNQQLLSSTTKVCPFCKTPTEKFGGCNHMTCTACQHEWCWLCGRTMGRNHFASWNLRGCPSALFRPSMSSSQLLWYKVGYIPFLMVLFLLYVVATILGLVLLMPLWPVVLCIRCLQCRSLRYCCRDTKEWLHTASHVGGYAIAVACSFLWSCMLLPAVILSMCYWVQREEPMHEIVALATKPMDVYHLLRRT